MAIDMTRNRTKKAGGGQARVTVTVVVNETASLGYDIDMSGYALDRAGNVLSDKHFVYFNNVTTPDGTVSYRKQGPEQTLVIDLATIDPEVAQVAVAVTVYGAAVGFGRVPGARITVRRDGEVLADYDLTAGLPNTSSVVYGRLARESGAWKFWAEGTAYPDLVATVSSFGVTTS
ncbi:MAG: TerD family protein [Gordonia amarae]